MTEQRKKLIDKFQAFLDTKPREQIIAAECANIAEEYHALQLLQPDVIKSVCRCKEGKQGRTIDENWGQICDVCGGS